MITLNGVEIVPTIFPDKTSQVWKLPEEVLIDSLEFNIVWRFESEAEFIHLAQLKTLLDTQRNVHCSLYIEYLPYARQDKRINNNRTFALYTFSILINTLRFNKVTILDPHSDIANKLIADSYVDLPIEGFCLAKTNVNPDVICFPDNGARSRYHGKLTTHYATNIVEGFKVREQTTGKITHYELVGLNDLDGKTVLILDDICDGGMTFCLLAKALYKAGAKSVHLFVTHGIFSKGLKPLTEAGIGRIFIKDGEVVEVDGHIAIKPKENNDNKDY